MKKTYIVVLTLVFTFVACFSIDFALKDTKLAGVSGYDSQQVLVIDAGHGGADCGTIGVDGALEKEINLGIALALYDFAKVCGYTTYLTRSGDYLVYEEGDDKSRSDLYNRFDYINSFDNSVLISIHQNHFENESEWGMQVWYSPNDDVSGILADSILNFTKTNIQPENKRDNKKSDDSYYLLYRAEVPSVMVECGFMSNTKENQLLQDSSYQKRIAYAILMGYNNFNEIGVING